MSDHDHQSGPVELGAPMDYAEHEKSYNGFVNAAKYTTLVVVALLISMAAGFFTAAGMISSVILFFLLCVVGVYFLR